MVSGKACTLADTFKPDLTASGFIVSRKYSVPLELDVSSVEFRVTCQTNRYAELPPENHALAVRD